jgi:transposase
VNSHKNARLTYQARRILVFRIIHEGLPVREVAGAQGVSPRTAYKWLKRYREEGRRASWTAVPVPTAAREEPRKV